MPISSHSREPKGTNSQGNIGRFTESQGNGSKVSATKKTEPRVETETNGPLLLKFREGSNFLKMNKKKKKNPELQKGKSLGSNSTNCRHPKTPQIPPLLHTTPCLGIRLSCHDLSQPCSHVKCSGLVPFPIRYLIQFRSLCHHIIIYTEHLISFLDKNNM